MRGWAPAALIAVIGLPGTAQAQAQDAAARNAKAAFVYSAQATQNAALKAMDDTLVTQRRRIDALGTALNQARGALRTASGNAGALKTRIAALEDEASAAQERFAGELARRDADYARELDTLRSAADAILATPDGLRALELNNQGDWEGVKRIEAELRAARQKARDMAAAADARAFAVLALDNREKRRETTAAVIARFEEVTRLDPNRCYDWLILAELYVANGEPGRAEGALARCERTASPHERMRVLLTAGPIAFRRGDRTGALAMLQKALDMAAALDTGDRRQHKVVLVGATGLVGDALLEMGDYAGAEARYRGALAEIDAPSLDGGDMAVNQQYAMLNERIGIIQAERGDDAAAEKSLRLALSLRYAFVAIAPEIAAYRAGLADTIWRIARIIARADPAKALAPRAEVVMLLRTLVKVDPTPAYRRLLASRLDDLAESQQAAQDIAAATASRREAAALRTQLETTP